jgi:transcription elongation factor GreA
LAVLFFCPLAKLISACGSFRPYFQNTDRPSQEVDFTVTLLLLFFSRASTHLLLFVMAKVQYYTQEALDRMKADLHELKIRGRADIARQIAEARDKGDLSENAEYDAAKDAQGLLEMKIAKLEEIVGNARVLDESSIDTSRVSILSKVKIKNTRNGAEVTYTIVSEEEANLKEQKISISSPFGKGLLGKKIGERAEIIAPAGRLEFEVLDIFR